MEMTIRWSNRDTDVDEFRIYRSDSKIDTTQLPTPLATVPSDTFAYVDQDVTLGGLYHYVVTAVKGGHEAQSMSRALAAIPHTGPGPETLLHGDAEFGIYGLVPSWQLFDREQLLNQLPELPSGSVRYQNPTLWVKYILNGVVSFMPLNANLLRSVSWVGVYNAGLIYGIDGSGDQSLVTPVNQLVRVQRNQYTFRIRTPTAWLREGASQSVSHSSYTLEWGMVIAPWMDSNSSNWKNPYKDDKERYGVTLGNFTGYFPWNDYAGEYGARTLLGSLRNDIYTMLAGDGDHANGTYFYANAGYTSQSHAYGWRPVLELEY